MFSLGESDLAKRILGCGDGPASFNAVATERGYTILSTDPLYSLTTDAIRNRIDETVPINTEQAHQNQEEFVWSYFGSVDELILTRVSAMNKFLNDFPDGLSTGRYIDATLPNLPFSDNQFDIALCSHFLFLYSEQHSLTFHLDAKAEMCRIASDVRIFPLLELGSVRSRHLDSVFEKLRARGYLANVVRVNYEFQSGGNEMLQIHAA